MHLVGLVIRYVSDTLQYDALTAKTPGLLGDTGLFLPFAFRELIYTPGRTFGLVKLSGELIEGLVPITAPNVVAIKPTAVGTEAGRIKKSVPTDKTDFDSLYFACAIDSLGESIPIACSVVFSSGRVNGLGSPIERYRSYDGGMNMAKADLDLENINYLSMTVDSADSLGLPVSILIDSLRYNVTKNGNA